LEPSVLGSAGPLFAPWVLVNTGVLGSGEAEGLYLSLLRPVKAFFKRPNTLCLSLCAEPVGKSAIVKRVYRFVMKFKSRD
jgi:hypothetical protein